ncbi:hypothetical protein H2204_004689 [Knufia peltigerae]|uniref:NAD-dependent epimerase/dehydratase domain-containing protein n=1 Tax=Knufia peltigerae TaxID=1002370 RepID=A0AA38Y789_9EURO|nr:hypothetical protein H2204_004689 [Knufia peltigerae]
MKTLVIGATGYIGSRIAHKFRSQGDDVYGLARTQRGQSELLSAGITPLLGDLTAIEQLTEHLDDFETIVFAATVSFEDEQQIIGSLLSRFAQAGKTLIFISGSGVVSTPAVNGEWNDFTAAEDDPFPFSTKLRNREVRLATEQLVLNAARDGFRGLIIRPPLVWGHGGSIQIPQFFESARKTGNVCYLGLGLNLYSHVHVDDVATAAYLASEKAVAGGVYHLVAGEVNFRTIAEAVGEVTECPTRSVTLAEAVELWGSTWVEIGLAVNSRLRAPKARSELGWSPEHVDLVADIRQGSYKKAFEEAKGTGRFQSYTWNAH